MCFYITQLFEVNRIAVCRTGCHIGDFLIARVNSCCGHGRSAVDGKSCFIDCYVIARFEFITCNAFKSCECFVQAEFVTHFFLCGFFYIVFNNYVCIFGFWCQFRSGHGINRSVHTRFCTFGDCHIVTCFDCGLGGFQLCYIDRVGVFRTCRHMGNLATCNDSVSCLIDFILAYTDGPFCAFPCRFQLFFLLQSFYEIRMLFLPCIKILFRFGFPLVCPGYVKISGQIIVFFFRGINNRCPFIIVFFFIQGRQGIFKSRTASCRNVSDATGLSACRRLCAYCDTAVYIRFCFIPQRNGLVCIAFRSRTDGYIIILFVSCYFPPLIPILVIQAFVVRNIKCFLVIFERVIFLLGDTRFQSRYRILSDRHRSFSGRDAAAIRIRAFPGSSGFSAYSGSKFPLRLGR